MWQTDWVLMLRYAIGDISDTPTYTDARLLTTLVIAASYVVDDIYFPIQYIVDTDNETINPDPTNDNDLTVLTVLRAACLIDEGNLITAARKAGVSIKIGPSQVQTDHGQVESIKTLLELSACALYLKAKADFEFGNMFAYRAILSPAVGPNIPNYVNTDGRNMNYNSHRETY